MFLLRFVIAMLSTGLIVMNAGVTLGQDYPNKPIRIITAGAGGGSDATARRIASGISDSLGQPIVVDNRQSILTGEIAAKAPPDGYTLLINGNSVWMNTLLRKAPYDVMKDLTPVTLIERTVNIVAVNSSSPIKSIKDLMALAKAKPGDLNYSGGGYGTTKHLAGELFSSMAGVKMVFVPYKGITAEIAGVLNGEVQLTFNDAGIVMTHVQSGRLRGLAVTSTTPSTLAPGLPTLAASGLPGYEAIGTTNVWAAGKAPESIVNRLNQEIVRFLTRPDVKEKFLNSGGEVVANSPEAFAAYIKADIVRVSKLIKDLGLKTE